jgi:hypothetical protein
LLLVCVGIIGNLVLNPESAFIFFAYYAVTLGLVLFLLTRTSLLRFILIALNESTESLKSSKMSQFNDYIVHLISKLNSFPVVYFSRGDNLASLNEAVQYVIKNEQTHHLTICHIYKEMNEIPESLARQIKIVDQLYPKLKVDLILIKGVFGQDLIDSIAEHLNVAKNRMFIGSPSGKFPHRIDDLGGVRLILSN